MMEWVDALCFLLPFDALLSFIGVRWTMTSAATMETGSTVLE